MAPKKTTPLFLVRVPLDAIPGKKTCTVHTLSTAHNKVMTNIDRVLSVSQTNCHQLDKTFFFSVQPPKAVKVINPARSTENL